MRYKKYPNYMDKKRSSLFVQNANLLFHIDKEDFRPTLGFFGSREGSTYYSLPFQCYTLRCKKLSRFIKAR
jgi:hypothetical protein